VVSGRIAATFPLPDAPSDFSAAIAEKSFVYADATALDTGVDGAELLVGVLAAALLEPPLELLVVLEFELPQAETATLAVMASAAQNVLLFSKCTVASPSPP
jgi:predicted glycosyltransferase